MSISYDKSDAPKDLRRYDDDEVARMAASVKENTREAAFAQEVLRLRRVVKRLVSNEKGR
jgi:hypothetical protein